MFDAQYTITLGLLAASVSLLAPPPYVDSIYAATCHAWCIVAIIAFVAKLVFPRLPPFHQLMYLPGRAYNIVATCEVAAAAAWWLKGEP